MNVHRDPGALTVVLAVIIALMIGVIGLWAVFSDIGPKDSIATRWLVTSLVYAAGAMAVGFLVPRRWYLALLTAWGPLVLGLMGLAVKPVNARPIPYWRFLALTILGVPGFALLFGYLGRRVRGPLAEVGRAG